MTKQPPISGASGRSAGQSLGRALERRVRRYVQQRDLIRSGDSILVAFSGGPDSTALLLLLSRLAPQMSLRLSAAYFDHRLRGEGASRQEREFVEDLVGRLRLPLFTGGGDVREYARERRLSVEEAARRLRYSFLAEAAGHAGAVGVATGHTADDQVETVLMHLLRGTGLSGLAGMSPLAEWPVAGRTRPAPRLVRPLLRVTRDEAAALCRQANLHAVDDASNRLATYRRNYLRLQTLPALREHNPRIDRAILRLAEAAAAEREALEHAAAAALAVNATIDGRSVRLSQAGLRVLPEGLRTHVFRLAVRRLLGDVQDIGWRHYRSLIAAVGKETGKRIDLPRALRVEVGYGEVVLTLGPTQREGQELPDEETPLAVPGRSPVAGWLFEAIIVSEAEIPPAAASPFEAWLDGDAVDGALAVRRRRAGDRFRPLGLRGEKKLQDIFVDAKVPRRERDRVPVVVDRSGIVWVAGHQIAERVKVTASTRRTLLLDASPEA